MLGEISQRAPRHLRVERQRLKRRYQGVAAERSRVPGHTGRREDAGRQVVAQDAQVFLAAPDEPIVQELVGGAPAGALLVPGRVLLLQRAQRAVEVEQRVRLIVADQRQNVDEQHEGLLWLQAQRQRRPAAVDVRHGVEHDLRLAPDAIQALVAERQARLRRGRRLAATEHRQRAIAAYLEDVLEVCGEPQLQLQVGGLPAAVLDPDALVKAAMDEA